MKWIDFIGSAVLAGVFGVGLYQLGKAALGHWVRTHTTPKSRDFRGEHDDGDSAP